MWKGSDLLVHVEHKSGMLHILRRGITISIMQYGPDSVLHAGKCETFAPKQKQITL